MEKNLPCEPTDEIFTLNLFLSPEKMNSTSLPMPSKRWWSFWRLLPLLLLLKAMSDYCTFSQIISKEKAA